MGQNMAAKEVLSQGRQPSWWQDRVLGGRQGDGEVAPSVAPSSLCGTIATVAVALAGEVGALSAHGTECLGR